MLTRKVARCPNDSFDFLHNLYQYSDLFHLSGVKQELIVERKQAFKISETFLEKVLQEYDSF